MAEQSSSKRHGTQSSYPEGIFLPWNKVLVVVVTVVAITVDGVIVGPEWLGWILLGMFVALIASNVHSASNENKRFVNLLQDNKDLNALAMKAVQKAREQGRD